MSEFHKLRSWNGLNILDLFLFLSQAEADLEICRRMPVFKGAPTLDFVKNKQTNKQKKSSEKTRAKNEKCDLRGGGGVSANDIRRFQI